jgi:hypothetical protein
VGETLDLYEGKSEKEAAKTISRPLRPLLELTAPLRLLIAYRSVYMQQAASLEQLNGLSRNLC